MGFDSYKDALLQSFPRLYTYMYVYIYICTYTYAYIYIYMHACMCIHKYIYIYRYLEICVLPSQDVGEMRLCRHLVQGRVVGWTPGVLRACRGSCAFGYDIEGIVVRFLTPSKER